jgi:hypothetical protein
MCVKTARFTPLISLKESFPQEQKKLLEKDQGFKNYLK